MTVDSKYIFLNKGEENFEQYSRELIDLLPADTSNLIYERNHAYLVRNVK